MSGMRDCILVGSLSQLAPAPMTLLLLHYWVRTLRYGATGSKQPRTLCCRQAAKMADTVERHTGTATRTATVVFHAEADWQHGGHHSSLLAMHTTTRWPGSSAHPTWAGRCPGNQVSVLCPSVVQRRVEQEACGARSWVDVAVADAVEREGDGRLLRKAVQRDVDLTAGVLISLPEVGGAT
jgi:hypothetical protein